VVFQPHLYSRTRDFAEQFAAALAPAEQVVLLDVYGAREQPMAGVGSALIGDPLRKLPGERAVLVGPTRDDAVAALVEAARPGDLLLTVGAGDVTALAPLIVQALRTRTEKVTR
jgi:UDP-N-acetylmuramate--alanine ligase